MLGVEINGKIMKYKNKEKHKIYVETFSGKNQNLTMNLRIITKYSGIENKL